MQLVVLTWPKLDQLRVSTDQPCTVFKFRDFPRDWLRACVPLGLALRSWANLRALQRLVAKEEMVLDVNVRERQVNGMKTLQLETLGASAIQCFDKVLFVYTY